MQEVVRDLLVEVEALRSCLLSVQATQGAYQTAYRETALLSHNATGPSGGWEKIIRRFYPDHAEDRGRAWRETLLMRRQGATADELAVFQNKAETAETYT